MYSIGQFSRLTGITTKTLIWYDKIGVLNPVKINKENGYRYYDASSFQRVFQIKYLQSLDFSINEIKNLSKEVLDSKIVQLKEKENFILANIDFLEKLKEENMKKEFFEVAKKMLNGKWIYQGSATNFKEVQETIFYGEKIEEMPKYLFFGEKNIGTDLKEEFSYNSNLFYIDNKGYCSFLLNFYDRLILYENEPDSKKTLYLHVYRRSSNDRTYSYEDILKILNKYEILYNPKPIAFNEKLIGEWEMIDYIYESEIKDYKGEIKEKNASYVLSPLFDKLEIVDEKTVYTLGKSENDIVELRFKQGTRIFNRENSIMQIIMEDSSIDNEIFSIINHLNNQLHKGMYKQIGESEYLFVNLDNNPDIDEKIYVYKKIKG